MSKRFVVTIEGTAAEDNLVTRHFMAKPWGVWHYMSKFWLLAAVPDSQTPKSIYTELAEIPGLSTTTILILLVSDHPQYWGLGDKEGWVWMEKSFDAKTA